MMRKKISPNRLRDELAQLFPRLWRYCLTLTANKSDADDLAQAACLRAMERSDQLKSASCVDRWLFRIAHRIWLNELRSAQIRRGGGLANAELFDLADAGLDPEATLIAQDIIGQIMHLPEAQRCVVLLVYGEGYSYREAAEVIEIPIGTVMSRLAAARKTLARHNQDRASVKAGQMI